MRIQIVDAFTTQPFAGNPAGVCLLPAGEWPDDTRLQQIAAELNHAETAFALPLPAGGEADWEIRWFTPTVEVGLCGHATLATAHSLERDGLLPASGSVRFRSRFHGLLIAHAGEEGRSPWTSRPRRPSRSPSPAASPRRWGCGPRRPSVPAP